jgi:hypothetical protein
MTDLKQALANLIANMSQDQVADLIKAVQGQGTAPSASPKGRFDLAAKDRSIVAGFRRKGIPVDQIVLMDRSDKTKPFNIKPYQAWLQENRIVRKGEKSVRGLFHVSQTDVLKTAAKIAAKAKAKPAKPEVTGSLI